MNEINRIIACRVVHDYTLELQFDDGYVGRVNLSNELTGPVFEPLRDSAVFNRVRVEDDTICWPNGADMDPNVLRYWCESGGVKNQAETDQWFARQFAAANTKSA